MLSNRARHDREHAPSIIFMDEVDSIGSARIESSGGGGGDSEVQRTMLELLNQLDGFEATNKIKVRPLLCWLTGHAAPGARSLVLRKQACLRTVAGHRVLRAYHTPADVLYGALAAAECRSVS